MQTSECKFLFCVPLGDLFNSVNILIFIINYCTIKFISAHCQPHRGFHTNSKTKNEMRTILPDLGLKVLLLFVIGRNLSMILIHFYKAKDCVTVLYYDNE